MALKTVIKQLLSKWGILSVDMQRAIQDDQKTFDSDGEGSYGDNKPDVIEAEDPFLIEQQGEQERQDAQEPNQVGGLDLEEV
jgi:recombination protein RecT